MKFSIAFTILFACLASAQDQDAIVLEQNQLVNPDGTYSYVWRTSNGINAEESGVGGEVATGSYSYISPDGIPVNIQYTADENGYRATGDALPVPPAIPEYIERALAYIRDHPPQQF